MPNPSVPSPDVRPDCPPWCRDHLDDRPNGGADLHQARLGTAGWLRVEVWQQVGGSINIELQIPGAPTQLLSVDDAAELAELLKTAAAVAESGQTSADGPSRRRVTSTRPPSRGA